MSHIVVDESRCKRDGICIAVCPAGLLEARADGVPSPIAGAEALCLGCGHCVAVCPHAAFSLRAMPRESCPDVRPEWKLDPDHVEHVLRARRSIRAYKDEEAGSGRLEHLIRIARYAPSGQNAQPVRWLVISGREPVRAIAGHVAAWMRRLVEGKPELARRMGLERIVAAWDGGQDRICRGAPHLVVAHAAAEDRTAPGASTLALAYLELAAPSLGLGACWAGYVHLASRHWLPLLEALALPAGQAFTGAMLVGVPKYRYHRLPLRREPEITWR